MNKVSRHNDLKNKIMLAMQKKYLADVVLHSRSVGLVYYKRGNRYFGPFRMGEKGLSDIYGSITIKKLKIAASFSIEVKTGKAVLTKEQEKFRLLDLQRECGVFVARSVASHMEIFHKWILLRGYVY